MCAEMPNYAGTDNRSCGIRKIHAATGFSGSHVKQAKTPRQRIATQQNKSVTSEIGSSYLDLAFQISVPQMCRRICRLVSFSRVLRAPRNLPCELLLWVRN